MTTIELVFTVYRYIHLQLENKPKLLDIPLAIEVNWNFRNFENDPKVNKFYLHFWIFFSWKKQNKYFFNFFFLKISHFFFSFFCEISLCSQCWRSFDFTLSQRFGGDWIGALHFWESEFRAMLPLQYRDTRKFIATHTEVLFFIQCSRRKGKYWLTNMSVELYLIRKCRIECTKQIYASVCIRYDSNTLVRMCVIRLNAKAAQ